MSRIASYYNRMNEGQRLEHDSHGELEFLRTKHIIEEFLPSTSGLSIVDVGGGTGPYAFWLAERGHTVSLFDLVPCHIDEALAKNAKADYPLALIQTADVRSLELEPESFDVVLLMGPMYHLTTVDERLAVLRKVQGWLKRDGIGFVACISRFGSMLDGFISGMFEDPEYLGIVRQDLETGVHGPNKENTRYFTDAYFHRPDEIEQEARSANLEIVDHVAVEGIGWIWQNFHAWWSDERKRDILLEMVSRTDREPSILGVSGHMILIVKK